MITFHKKHREENQNINVFMHNKSIVVRIK